MLFNWYVTVSERNEFMSTNKSLGSRKGEEHQIVFISETRVRIWCFSVLLSGFGRRLLRFYVKQKFWQKILSLEFSDLEYFGSNAICPQAHYLYFAVITLLTLTVLEAFRKCKKIVTLFDNNDL